MRIKRSNSWGKVYFAIGRIPAFLSRRNMLLLLLGGFCALLLNDFSHAQIGGETAADGPFMLDDAEDLDLIADGVEREWVSDYFWPDGYILNCTTISALGLTPAAGQTPIGTLTATIPETDEILAPEGWISASFGVPVPATPGLSTATAPADITSFTTLTFWACFDPILEGQEFQVVLETYPGPDYPKIHWFFSPVAGSVFEQVSIDLWAPDLIENADELTLAQMLSQCRYLSFYCFAGPVPLNTRMHFHIDDIQLKSDTTGVSLDQWQGY